MPPLMRNRTTRFDFRCDLRGADSSVGRGMASETSLDLISDIGGIYAYVVEILDEKRGLLKLRN